MPGQIRGDIDRMTNTVISVAEEARQFIRWGQAVAREVYDGFDVEVVVDSEQFAPIVQAVKCMFLCQPRPAGKLVLPVSLRVKLKEKGE